MPQSRIDIIGSNGNTGEHYMSTRPLVIYHDNCADGFGAAFAAWLKFGDEAEYAPMQYGFKEEDLPIYFDRDIYMVDFSWPKIYMDRLLQNAKRVVWLDHHKTAFELFGVTPNKSDELYLDELYLDMNPISTTVVLDNNRSGALIAWKYFHPDKEIPLLIRYIDDYDRWQFKIEGTKEFNKALWSYAPWSFTQWNDYFIGRGPTFTKWRYEDMQKEGAAILRAYDANVRAVVKEASRECKMTGPIPLSNADLDCEYELGLAANCYSGDKNLINDVGLQLANQSGTYGLLWQVNKEGKCICSLRSNGDYDVSAIARVFGGGGHKTASGFEIDIQTLLKWIK